VNCRPGCAACCIAPSISSPIPPLIPPLIPPPGGGLGGPKPAGVPCPQLLPDLRCALFGRPERPRVCAALQPQPEMCGTSREHALHFLQRLERATAPELPARPQ